MLFTLLLLLAGGLVSSAQFGPAEQRYAPVKSMGFTDPNTNYLYQVVSYNVTQMTASSSVRSFIKVSKVKLRDTIPRTPVGEPEFVQTLKFQPPLVDFDLHCVPTHCYLVAVTSKSRQNVELFSWQRTQFDLQARRDSFSRPFAIKLFRIQSGFYIALAQEQLHLTPYKLAQEYEEPVRFIGCTILKFIKGHEHSVKYHQFIRLPFNPLRVHYFTSINSSNATGLAVTRPIENHHLVFSVDSNWADVGASQAQSYIWSPLDDHFWPYRMPRGLEVLPRPGPSGGQLVRVPINLPPLPPPVNQSFVGPPPDYVGPIEACFHQLQHLIADRDVQARQLLESSRNIWRSNQAGAANLFAGGQALTNISAQVIVHGNVTVLGSLIESPQISLIAGHSSPIVSPPSVAQVSQLINSHSPAIVENRLKQAMFKLEHMRQKLSRAVLANLAPQSLSIFNNQVRFFGTIEANEIIFSGVENSNVQLNGIPFRQLEHELVSLDGVQDISTKVVFNGRVVADVLEIHGQINDYFFLKDALDITSRQVQIIDANGQNHAASLPGLSAVEFQSISAPEVIMAPNATINSIRLDDFITRDNRTQFVYGRKSFKRLMMGKLDLADQTTLLNDFNINRLARNAIHLRGANMDGKQFQTISGFAATFLKGVQVKQLLLNNMINRHINLTSLIHDSVKANDASLQQINGQKSFFNTLKINRLTTEGALNGIEVAQIFNLNPAPPIADQNRLAGNSMLGPPADVPITGQFHFRAPVAVRGTLNTELVNGIDLTRRAVRRLPPGQGANNLTSTPQIVYGHKTFYKPARVVNSIRLIDLPQVAKFFGTGAKIPYPLINNIDLRLINAGLVRQKQQPTLINVEDLEIEGNLNLPSSLDRNGPPRITLGNYSVCPLDLIRKRLVLAGNEDQYIETPIRVNSLRARSIVTGPGTLNGFRLPQDFVLRTSVSPNQPGVELVFGNKFIDNLVISPSNLSPRHGPSMVDTGAGGGGIILDSGVSVNQVDHAVLQTFIQHERQHNSTGEKIFNTMNVYGNLYAKRINKNRWPEDILLKSASSSRGQSSSPYQHKRIYSRLVFLNSSNLHVANQLVLRGPIQLNGRVNGVNLTEFARQSATYGDKDLYSIGRPIRNKIFLGGVTVTGEIRSQGLIDGINFEEMKQRVVTITPKRERTLITGPKMFMSDAIFEGPVSINYLNDIPMDRYLRQIQFVHDSQTLLVRGKKTVTGSLRINRNLFVRGLINGIDFAELQARAISLAPMDKLTFNKTLTVEGDVFMDNLWIDERNGTIDGVKLTNLLPVGTIPKDELILQAPRVDRRADPFGRVLSVGGSFLDCQVSCNLQPLQLRPGNQSLLLWQQQQQQQQQQQAYPSQPAGPVIYPAQSVMAYTSRPAFVEASNGRNYTLTRTTPPYSLSSTYQPPLNRYPTTPTLPRYQSAAPARLPAGPQRQISSLVQRAPAAINYEQRASTTKRSMEPGANALVSDRLEGLRRHIVSINMIRLTASSNVVVGFIEASTNDVSGLEHPDEIATHSEHNIKLRSYLQLDQIDFPFHYPNVYHLSVGVTTNQFNQNKTSVFSSLGDSNAVHELSALPVEFPNSAMFLHVSQYHMLFLLISQDYSINTGMCATGDVITKQLWDINQPRIFDLPTRRAESGIHVYMFTALHNSSSLYSAFFDLYQTIDLPGIDSFEQFTHHGSNYVLAISRSVGRVYLMILRGYSGFQIVSHMETPMVERVTVMFTHNREPILMIHQTSGLHRLMEPVII